MRNHKQAKDHYIDMCHRWVLVRRAYPYFDTPPPEKPQELPQSEADQILRSIEMDIKRMDGVV